MLTLLLTLATAGSTALAAPCATGVSPWYRDTDGDGYGVTPVRLFCNDYPHPGWSAVSGDCDDSRADVSPAAQEVCDGVDNDCDGEVDLEGGVDTCPHDAGSVVYWGDIHAHSGLSEDGCEDEKNWCIPRGALPGADGYAEADAAGLDFACFAEHAEFRRYIWNAGGVAVDIWAQQQEWVAQADGGPVLPVLGYEFTAAYGHRTVIFDTPTACTAYRMAANAFRSTSKGGLGIELYKVATPSGYTTSAEFEAGMLAAEVAPECAPTRWLSWFHHPAYRTPAAVDWDDATNQLATDRVVEIASEHGSSECADRAWPGCGFWLNGSLDGDGSVQAALQRGLRLGFVGGTDTHDGRPGSLDDGPSYVGEFDDTDGDGQVDTPRRQFTNGAITGVYVSAATPLTRASLFDAIEARHTLAATWPVDGLQAFATGEDGVIYLPGDAVPESAGALTVTVELDDPAVTAWYAELVDPTDGAATEVEPFVLDENEVVYLRIRAWVGDEEERLWASPWFGGVDPID